MTQGTLLTPVLSGSDSVVGIARESTWGTTPTTGSDPNKTITGAIFFPMKEESIDAQPGTEPQRDDMGANREITRIPDGGRTVEGGLRFLPGPESIGYLFTMLFGTPNTSTLAASSGTAEAAYQHIWYPGYQTRANWPVPYSIESRFSDVRSKLIRGALLRRLALDIPNNGLVSATPDFLAKDELWLTTASGGTDDDGRALPAKITASPTLIDEEPWHWIDVKAYPQIDNVDQQMVTSLSFEFMLNLVGLFTGGSGKNIGSYRVDNFELSGRSTIEFDDETLWMKFYRGLFFQLEATLEADTIQGAYKNSLEIIAYDCKATRNANVNQVGSLQYDFGWTAREDPTEGKSCQITLVNTVASYA